MAGERADAGTGEGRERDGCDLEGQAAAAVRGRGGAGTLAGGPSLSLHARVEAVGGNERKRFDRDFSEETFLYHKTRMKFQIIRVRKNYSFTLIFFSA